MATIVHRAASSHAASSSNPRRRRREPAHLAMNPTLGDKPQAGHHFLLVHVETGTALM